MNKILEIKDFKLGYGNEEVIYIDNLSLKKNTITCLLGPSGCGKSSLLSAIMSTPMSPSYWQEGAINLQNKKKIEHIPQKARLYTGTILENIFIDVSLKKNTTKNKIQIAQKVLTVLGLWNKFKSILCDPVTKHSIGTHKLILITKSIIKKPLLLLLDEILSDTSVKEEVIIINLIKRIKKITTILLITHNKEEAKEMCDYIALVSGGILHEYTASDVFFNSPQSDIGKEFLKNGSAWYTNPINTQRAENILTVFRRFSSMCEFFWVIQNKIGGMQKPGLNTNLETDLAILEKLNVNILITLQQKPLDKILLEKHGIQGIHFPILDMGIPTFKDLHELYKTLDKYKSNNSIVYHCKAGMGRTGLMLACHLLWIEKISAIQAIGAIRQINYKYIQTDEQLEFICLFENTLKNIQNNIS